MVIRAVRFACGLAQMPCARDFDIGYIGQTDIRVCGGDIVKVTRLHCDDDLVDQMMIRNRVIASQARYKRIIWHVAKRSDEAT